jgi:hypothetical protein
MLSASGVMGPLAPSVITLALMFGALAAVMTFSPAAGTKMSHSASRRLSVVSSAPGKPVMVLLACVEGCGPWVLS